MASKSILQGIADKWWDTVALKVPRAVVFADGPAAEFLHWHQGGLAALIARGALNVRELNPDARGWNHEKKAVFLVSGPLHGATLLLLQHTIQASSFQVCIVITSASASTHLQAKEQDEMHIFYTLEDRILQWMGNMNFTAEVLHVPMFLTPITQNFFVMPPFANIFPLLPWETDGKFTDVDAKKKIYRATQETVTYASLPSDMQIELKHLICCLNSLFEEVDVQEEIFSVGSLSHIVASELESLPAGRTRRKVARGKAMLLLVDRTMDLAGPLSQETTTMLDRVVRVLPGRHQQTLDVEVDMQHFCAAHKGHYVAKGCLSQKEDKRASVILNHMINKKQKDFLVELNRQIVDVASRGGIKMDVSARSGRLTAELLEQRLMYLRQNLKVLEENVGFVQTAMAAIQALRDPGTKLDRLQSSEKLLVQNMDVSEEGPSRNVIHLINQRKQSSLTLSDLIGMLAFLFALNGENALGSEEDEENCQTALVEAIFQDLSDGLPNFLQSVIGPNVSDEVHVLERIRFLFQSLKSLGNLRKDLKKYRKVFFTGGTSEPAHYRPFLKQLVDNLFKPDGPEMADITFHSGGLRDMLKSGFSLFMNVAKPQPRNYSLVVVVVLGGMMANEVRLIRESVSLLRAEPEVLIGTTVLSTPENILERIFSQPRL